METTMGTTMTATWGDESITVSADWAQASAPIKGLPGRQVADVRHSPREALWQAVTACVLESGTHHSSDCETDREGYDSSCPCCTEVAAVMETARESNDGTLMDYATGESIRPATAVERRRSLEAAEQDGGSGVIRVDGRSVYVAD